MVVAALVAAGIGQVFDGALLIVIFATSGALEAWATQRTAASVRALLNLTPEQATRLSEDGREELVDTSGLAVGDRVLVRPGVLIGADAEVVEGASEVDQASITGEPLPVLKQTGDEVFAGTLNGTGALTVQVNKPASESVLARIVTMVEQASATKATAAAEVVGRRSGRPARAARRRWGAEIRAGPGVQHQPLNRLPVPPRSYWHRGTDLSHRPITPALADCGW